MTVVDKSKNQKPLCNLADSRDGEPIAAVATPPGAGAIALIRLSGFGVHHLLKPLLRSRLEGSSWEERKLYHCQFVIREKVLDEPLVVLFHAPRSFTGQESAEIHCHGSPFIVQAMLEALYSSGVRPAEPGEFTRRAFLAGKMDLTQAEGLKDLIAAQTEEQWHLARRLSEGALTGRVQDLRRKLVEAMAYLEARIDFPEEGDTTGVDLESVSVRVAAVQRELERLRDSYRNGRIAAQGLRVAILGAPNAGKSTLLNALLDKNRAIVSPIAGTTRDYLEESCLINGRLIRIIDTAGIRESADQIEQEGIERSRRLAADADLIIALADAHDGPMACSRMELELASLPKKDVVRVLSKGDLTDFSAKDWLRISCASTQGLAELKNKIAEWSRTYVAPAFEDVCVTSARQWECVRNAEAALTRFKSAFAAKQYEECLAFELQEAATALGHVLGAISNEDILDKIFSEFCIGK